MVSILLALACSPGNPEVHDTGELPLPWACEGDHDGTIVASELAAVPGLSVPYLVNAPGTTAAVDPAGSEVDGELTWDFTGGPEVPVDLDVVEPADAWFAEHFPAASHAAPMFAHATDLLGVFASSDSSVDLLGLVSRDPAPAVGRTLVVYDTAVPVMRFPLSVGSTWSADTTFSDADILGVKNAGEEHYAFEVDAAGTALLPGFTIDQTLRLQVELEQTFAISVGPPTVSTLQVLFVRECVGELARMVSLPDEDDPSFSLASEFRRLDTEH